MRFGHEAKRQRTAALFGALLIHGLIGGILFGTSSAHRADATAPAIKLFRVAAPAPPPPVREQVRATPARAEPAQLPAGKRTEPATSDKPAPTDASTLVLASSSMPASSGGDVGTAGSGDSGGGEAGGEGTGSGVGGSRAVRIAGALNGYSDYPRFARRLGLEGTVAVRFTVDADGRARDCAVIRSTIPELDGTTCRLIEERFRYRPARDGRGEPIEEVVRRTFEWSLPT